MIIFELILTTFKSSVVFRGSWGSCVYWLKTKIDSPLANLACKNPETLFGLVNFIMLLKQD